MKIFKSTLVIALVSISIFCKAQGFALKISGEVTNPLSLNNEMFNTFKKAEVTRKDKDGKDHKFSGVLLSEILAKAGATLGGALRGENLTKYVLAEASDGYQVIFALAELDPEFADRRVILASQMDGKPLPVADGPYRIIVEGEKKPARCIKQLTEIKVVFAR